MSDTPSSVFPAPLAAAAQSPPAARRPRLWPGIVLVALYWAVLKLPGFIDAEPMTQFMIVFFGSMAVPALFAVWWLFFSRVRWADRFFGLLACAAVGAAAFFLSHPSFQKTGLFGPLFYSLPVVMTGWVLWLLVARWLSRQVRLAGLVVVFLLTWGYFATVRFEGTTGAFDPQFSYRWNPSAEDKFLAESATTKPAATPAVAAAAPLELTPGDWPGFRGPARDGRQPGVRLATDWAQHPPKQLWRHRVGPGWSSFAVVGPRLYTQEQRGGNEVVVCYDAGTGTEVWAYEDATRFDEAMGGAGPRATPTFHAGKIYALGANGRLNCLDAATGKKVWSRDIAADAGAKVPMWGFASSPLVVQGIVTVFAGGPDGKGVLGYHAASGDLAWTAGDLMDSYCSLHPARLDGVEQLLISTGTGLTAFDPVGGKVLWQYEWLVGSDYNRVTQPTVIGESDVLIGTGFGFGTRRLHVTRDGDGWKTDQVWESKAISPYYNDLVIHNGHIYGFHNQLFACVSLDDGKGKWKERGYASGQVVLLPDQDLLLIQAENGDVALVEAKPDARKELARFHAIDGKTWNHPVVAHGRLYVRNGEEAACYQLAEDTGGAKAE
jgi:outer membrane protein assembly factor BamB